MSYQLSTFQSTHPSRGATRAKRRSRAELRDFNPRTPRGVRRFIFMFYVARKEISIHAPLAGCDCAFFIFFKAVAHFNPRTPRGVRRVYMTGIMIFGLFQSTHPSRGATDTQRFAIPSTNISIHAPLAGCDSRAELWLNPKMYFNPRTPRGVRQYRCGMWYRRANNFNPRTPRGVRRLYRKPNFI